MKIVKIITALLFALLVIWLLASGNLPLKETSDDKPIKNRQSKEDKVKKPIMPDIKTLDSSINQIISQNSDLNIGVAITDLQTKKTHNYGENGAYVAASVNKVVTAMAYVDKVEAGNATLSQYVGGDTAQNQIKKSLVDSDNTAWESFYKSKEVSCLMHNEYAKKIGLSSYDCVQNMLSAPDYALLLTLLYENKLANKTHTDMILGYLKEANYREYITSAIPKDLTIYHKAGYLPDRVLDGAIITDGKKSYVLAIFSKSMGTYDTVAGIDVFQSITNITNKIFLDK